MTENAKPKQEVAKPLDIARTFLTDPTLQAQLKVAANKYTTPERIARIALTAVLQSPKLAECFTTPQGKASIAKSLLTATQRGLEVDGRQAHLVPFRCKLPGGGYAMQAQFIPGYQGLCDLSYNHPSIGAIWAEEVYEKDEFIYEKGLSRTLIHRPYTGDDDPGPLKAAYAVCEMKSGSKVFVVLTKRDITRIRASSRSAGEPDSPWNKHEAAMWKKSAIRALCKMIPQSNELRDALADDDEVERPGPIINITPAKVADPLALTGEEPGIDQGPEPGKAPPKSGRKPAVSPDKPEWLQLQEFVLTECGSSWDRFYQVSVEQGWVSDASEATTFQELEAAACITLLQNREMVKVALQGE